MSTTGLGVFGCFTLVVCPVQIIYEELHDLLPRPISGDGSVAVLKAPQSVERTTDGADSVVVIVKRGE